MCRLLDELLAFADVGPPEDCWNWQARKNVDGYGKVSLFGRDWLAHRLVYEAMRGDVPDDLTCDHLCRNRACVNPYHIELVDPVANVMRGEGFGARNARKTHCGNGHPFNEQNTYMHRGRRHCRSCNREGKGRHRHRLASLRSV